MKEKYAPFKDALDAATDKLGGYYTKTAESDAHILAMCMFYSHIYHLLCLWWSLSLGLHPAIKLGHFKKYWGSEQRDKVLKLVEKKVNSFSILTVKWILKKVMIVRRMLQEVKLHDTYLIDSTLTGINISVSNRPSSPTESRYGLWGWG